MTFLWIFLQGNSSVTCFNRSNIISGADGSLPPPMLIFPRKRIERHMCIIPSGEEFIAGKSENGWITFETLFEYLVNGFSDWLTSNKVTRPVLVFADWHETRANYFLAERLTSLGIVLIGLLPNTTHILQPLDVAVFGPLQRSWRQESIVWRRNHPDDDLTTNNFASVFIPFYYKTIKEEHIVSGFETCGIYPFNPDQPDYSKLEPAAAQKQFPTPAAGIDQSKKTQHTIHATLFHSHISIACNSKYMDCLIECYTDDMLICVCMCNVCFYLYMTRLPKFNCSFMWACRGSNQRKAIH